MTLLPKIKNIKPIFVNYMNNSNIPLKNQS